MFGDEELDYEKCPNCREPLQGEVCRCGCNVREADWDYCYSCKEPTLEEDLEREKRIPSRSYSIPRTVIVCPDCR